MLGKISLKNYDLVDIQRLTPKVIDKVNAEGGADNSAVQPTTPPGVSACSTGGAAASEAPAHTKAGGGCGCD